MKQFIISEIPFVNPQWILKDYSLFSQTETSFPVHAQYESKLTVPPHFTDE